MADEQTMTDLKDLAGAVNVREWPDQRVRHEDRAGDDDREGDDEPPVHDEPPLVQLRTSSRSVIDPASGNAVIVVAVEPQLRDP